LKGYGNNIPQNDGQECEPADTKSRKLTREELDQIIIKHGAIPQVDGRDDEDEDEDEVSSTKSSNYHFSDWLILRMKMAAIFPPIWMTTMMMKTRKLIT
jgi:hypothetical protein